MCHLPGDYVNNNTSKEPDTYNEYFLTSINCSVSYYFNVII